MLKIVLNEKGFNNVLHKRSGGPKNAMYYVSHETSLLCFLCLYPQAIRKCSKKHNRISTHLAFMHLGPCPTLSADAKSFLCSLI